MRGRGLGGAPRGRGEGGQQQAHLAHPHPLDARPASRRPPWQSPLQLLVRARHGAALRGVGTGWRGRSGTGRGGAPKDSRGGGPQGPPPSTARAARRSWSRTVPSTGGRGQRSTSTPCVAVSGRRPPRPLSPLPARPLEVLAPPTKASLPESERPSPRPSVCCVLSGSSKPTRPALRSPAHHSRLSLGRGHAPYTRPFPKHDILTTKNFLFPPSSPPLRLALPVITLRSPLSFQNQHPPPSSLYFPLPRLPSHPRVLHCLLI